MPVISRFFGITIRMHANDHAPPHFHAIYGEHEALVGIDPPDILRGALPRRITAMVLCWAALHRVSLLDNWQRLREERLPRPIAPLE